MSSKPVIMVIGASGNVGSATIRALALNYADNFEIRAGVRNPDKAEKLKEFQGKISIVKATMGDDNLSKILRGVSRLFIVTPGVENRVDLTIRTAQSAKLADVESIVVISIEASSMTSTILGNMFKDFDSTIEKLGIPCTFLLLSWFIDNHLSFRESIINQSSVSMAIDPTKPFTTMAVSDAGKAAAAILAEPAKHAGMWYHINSNTHTMNEVCAEFSRQLGKQIQYIRVSYEDTKKGMMQSGVPGWLVDSMLEVFHMIDEGSQVTNQSNMGDYQKITGMAPTSLHDWISSVINLFM